jgi:hypothetical protein
MKKLFLVLLILILSVVSTFVFLWLRGDLFCGHDREEYVAQGKDCRIIKYMCRPGTKAFSDSCGCGCTAK